MPETLELIGLFVSVVLLVMVTWLQGRACKRLEKLRRGERPF